jgi:hypothetical protein
MRIPRLFIFFILLLKGSFSFSQVNYELFTIDTDTTFNSRFDVLEQRMFGYVMSASMNVYRDDLRTVVGVDEPKNSKDPGQYSAENVNVYTLRNENGDHYISPTLNGKTSVWISFSELKKVFKDAEEYSYIEDLFLKHKTRVSYSENVRIIQYNEMENGMESFHREIQNGLLSGELTAYEDPQFMLEMTVSMIRGNEWGVDTEIIQNPNTGMLETFLIAVTRFPCCYKYLYDCALENGRIIRDSDFPIAFAPMDTNMHGGYHLHYWVRTDQMAFLLPQWRREMIKAWEKGKTGDYLVDRFSVSYVCMNQDPDSLWMRKFISKTAGLLMEGKMTAYRDPSFQLEMTVSETRNVLNGRASDYSNEPVELENTPTGQTLDWFGLDEIHYRADDHSFKVLSYPIAIAFAYSRNDHCIPGLFLYLPELKGVINAPAYDSLLLIMQKKIKISEARVSVDSLGNLKDKTGKNFSPVNLPAFYWAAKDTLSMELRMIYDRVDKADAPDSVYVIAIGESKLAPPKMLVPYLVWGNSNGTFSTGGIFRPTVNIYDAGYCDESGIVRVPIRYNNAEPFSEERGLVTNYTYGKSIQPLKHCGFVDMNGVEVVPLSFEDARSFSSGLAAVKKNGKWGYIDASGKEKIGPRFEIAYDFHEGQAIVKVNGKFGLINKRGKLLGKFTCDTITSFVQGMAQVRVSTRWGAINAKGKLILDTIYQYVTAPNGGSFLATDFSGESYLFGCDGKVRGDTKGVHVQSAYGNTLVVQVDSGSTSWICLLNNQKVRISKLYSKAGDFSEGLLPVQKNGRWGFIDSTGKEVIACKYEKANSFSEGLALVSEVMSSKFDRVPQLEQYRPQRQFFIDRSGKEFLAVRPNYFSRDQYDPKPKFKNGLMKIRLSTGQVGYLSRDGREYIYH